MDSSLTSFFINKFFLEFCSDKLKIGKHKSSAICLTVPQMILIFSSRSLIASETTAILYPIACQMLIGHAWSNLIMTLHLEADKVIIIIIIIRIQLCISAEGVAICPLDTRLLEYLKESRKQ